MPDRACQRGPPNRCPDGHDGEMRIRCSDEFARDMGWDDESRQRADKLTEDIGERLHRLYLTALRRGATPETAE